MKYLILVPDGAGDEKIDALGGKTPLEAADMPFINSLAAKGEVGMVRTIPPGVAPGSDAANLSVMGYDPAVYLTGRSPLEAASIGIEMSDTDVAFRTNIITCMIVHNGGTDYELTPPHDVLEQRVGDHLPKGQGCEFITAMMKKSYDILKDHPVNKARIERGLNPANSLWIWGQGKKPQLSSFYDRYQLTGTAISAVDLIKGIAICAGLSSVDVEGATGTLHTNFKGKADAAIREFRDGKDFVYVHLEGPDECSHKGDMEGKLKCLHDIDQKVLAPIVEALRADGEDFKILEVPDHRTPLAIRTHSSTPVPFVVYDSTAEKPADESRQFNEKSGEIGSYYDSGFALADHFILG